MNPPGSTDDLSTHLHRQVIGWLGSLLPIVVWFFAGTRPTEGLERQWAVLGSISAYYYTGGGVAFVGILAALAVFLLTYRGYGNAYRLQDRVTATVAGAASALVAVFPTRVPDRMKPPSWWTAQIGAIHYAAAFVLFASFIFFSLFLFTKSDAPQASGWKRARNGIYVFCGIGMIGCVIWAAIAGAPRKSIFVPEALALELFAFSWLAKGRAEWTAGATILRIHHYARHPDRLRADIAGAVREISGR